MVLSASRCHTTRQKIRLNWTPHDALWNSRGILIHISDARDRWLAERVRDGDPYPNIWTTARSLADMHAELARTFDRLQRFLGSQQQLDTLYHMEWDGQDVSRTGHGIALHLLEHDIHHRAELLQRLALLGVDHGIDI
jgi:uncharacterized damage-inducible protein DinB